MRSRAVRTLSMAGVVALAAMGLCLILPPRVLAQAGAGSSGMTEVPIGGATAEGLPSTSIAPAGAPAAAPTPVRRHRPAHTAARHRTVKRVKPVKAAAPMKFEVEPAKAVLELRENTLIYTQPSIKSRPIKKGDQGKFVIVTGSTHYFVRAKLRDGQVGYVLLTAVDLVKPTDKIFVLTRDAPVLSQPNHWGKKLSEVHHGHAVHVVGVALNYAKIKMRSGLEGYIPMTALE